MSNTHAIEDADKPVGEHGRGDGFEKIDRDTASHGISDASGRAVSRVHDDWRSIVGTEAADIINEVKTVGTGHGPVEENEVEWSLALKRFFDINDGSGDIMHERNTVNSHLPQDLMNAVAEREVIINNESAQSDHIHLTHENVL